MKTDLCAECREPILEGQLSLDVFRGGDPTWTPFHLACWHDRPDPRFVIPGEPEKIAWAREAYDVAFYDLAYWEACGCSTCDLALLQIDARSLTLDLLVAELYRPAAALTEATR